MSGSTLSHACSPCEVCGICICGAAHAVRVGLVKVCGCGYCPECSRKLGNPHHIHFVHDCQDELAKLAEKA